MKVLIVYYSTYGNVYRMATLVAEGVQEIPGVQPVVRTVPELIPQSVIEAREDMKAGREMQQNVPLVTLEDFRNAGAYAGLLTAYKQNGHSICPYIEPPQGGISLRRTRIGLP
jgi:hypothetical protein